jgi:hypothetical protein
MNDATCVESNCRTAESTGSGSQDRNFPGLLAVTTHRRRGQHRLELAGVSEGELPQQLSDNRVCIHTAKQCLHPATADHVDVIDAVRTRAHIPATTVASFGAGFANPT